MRVVMNNELTPGDIKKMEDEIEYRVLCSKEVQESERKPYKISSEDDKDSHDYIRRFGR